MRHNQLSSTDRRERRRSRRLGVRQLAAAFVTVPRDWFTKRRRGRRTPKRFALTAHTTVQSLPVFSLEREIVQLREDGVLDETATGRLIAIERRQVVSLYGELRFLAWGGVMLIVAGVGVLVSKNLERIGPLSIAVAITAAAIGCYAYSEWRRRAAKKEGFTHSLVDDYILLLAALLASADVGFIEHQWHLLGANWQRHFLLLALLHGVTAYLFNSRLVLSLSISSLAAFLGIERRMETLFGSTTDMALRAFLCSAIVFAWRAIDTVVRARLAVIPSRPDAVIPSRADGEESPANSGRSGDSSRSSAPGMTVSFSPVFDHFATNLAFWGALILTFEGSTRTLGCIVAIVFAIASAWYGLRVREEMFVVYAWIYGVIAVDVFAIDRIWREEVFIALYLIVSTIAAVAGLRVIHVRMRKAAA